MTIFHEIAVLSPSNKSIFHYHLPSDWDPLETGTLVIVPFGAQKVNGIVVGSVVQPEAVETKPVESVVDPIPVVSPFQIHLARWMSEYYKAGLNNCLSVMLPPGLARNAEGLYELADPEFRPEKPISQRLIRLLKERGPLRTGQIRKSFGPLEWEREAERLVRSGVIRRRSILPPPTVRPKKIRMVQLGLSSRDAQNLVESLRGAPLTANRKAAAERRARVIESLLAERKPVAIEWVYASSGANLGDLKTMAEEGWVDFTYEEIWRDPLMGKRFEPKAALQLTDEQEEALRPIAAALREERAERFLLYGITGSGKTEVYIRAAEAAVAGGRQALILVPEIALTPQMVQRFGARFPGRLGLMHSRLSPGERYDVWRRARAGRMDVVLGPRSALFAPLPKIGLIVLDEEHDSSYKSESSPQYHAREAAWQYAGFLKAACVLGSATPDLGTYYQAKSGGIRLLTLTRRVAESLPAASVPQLPAVEVVDMRQELRAGNRSMFSRALSTALEDCLSRGEQAILFLNRRGTSSAILCRSCGNTVDCPRCSLPLTVHGETLLCHHCYYRRAVPPRCPHCGSPSIRALGVGTQQVEAEVQKQFPAARTLRWDRDAVEEVGEHDILLEHFASHRADVLVGTQMIAQGLDLPQVTLVGIVLADIGLLLPDFRAPERVFQVLMQVAGRAGRADRPGKVVLQTYSPQNYVLDHAAGHDYPGFAESELERRRSLVYPPFQKLVRLVFLHHEEQVARRSAEAMAETLLARIAAEERLDSSLIGPAPCFFARIGGRYRWHIILRGPQPASLIELPLPEGWQVDVDPVTLL